jgi:hypothetical protein
LTEILNFNQLNQTIIASKAQNQAKNDFFFIYFFTILLKEITIFKNTLINLT